MKKIAIGMLTLLLFVSLLCSAQAASNGTALTPPGEEGGFVSMAAMGDTLYLLANTGLYTWRPGETEPSLLGAMPEETNQQAGKTGVSIAGGGVMMVSGGGLIDQMFTREGKLYGLDSEDGSIYLMEAADGKVTLTKTQSLQWDTMVQSQGGFSFPNMISDVAVADGYLYLLKAGMDASKNELLRFNLLDGGFIKYDAALVAGFAPYKDGKALILQYASEQDAMARTGKQWLNVLDLTTGKVTKGIESFPFKLRKASHTTQAPIRPPSSAGGRFTPWIIWLPAAWRVTLLPPIRASHTLRRFCCPAACMH